MNSSLPELSLKSAQIGHFCQFVSRTCNKGTVEVTGAVVNRGAGYGMEVPCKYRLYDTRAYVERVQKIIRENYLS